MSRPQPVDPVVRFAEPVLDRPLRFRLGLDAYRRPAWYRDSLRRRLLAGADAVAAELAILVLMVGSGANVGAILWALAFVPMLIVAAKIHGLYDRDHRALRHLTVDELPAIFLWAITGVAGLATLLSLTPGGEVGVWPAIGACALACVCAFLLRSMARALWRRITPRERTLIIGSGALAEATKRKLDLFPDMHLELVGFHERLSTEIFEPGLLMDIDRVILASPAIDDRGVEELLALCRRHKTKLSVVPPVRAMFGTAVHLEHVAELPVVQYNTWDVSRSTLLLKRALDITVSLVALAVLAPLFLLIALTIRAGSPGRVLFSQLRAGRGGKPFCMRKFRTMHADAERELTQLVPFDALPEPMFKLVNDPRVTRVGRLLRRTSLDELPQLLNVLIGDMSLVGPRPEQIELVERYPPEHRFRLEMKPGMTGPMQVFGRGDLTFEERLAVEREYVENLTFGRDLRILAMTLPAVIGGDGAY